MSGNPPCRAAGSYNAGGGAAISLPRARYLFVVSTQHRELYELLIERFQDDRNVEVVLDRRATATDRADGYTTPNRRQRPEDELTVRSHLIITRE